MALHRRESMQMSKTFIYPLSIWKKWKDMLAPRTKAIVLSLWAIETHMNPNQKKVVKKRLGLHLYENKLIQHLMETQVIFSFILGFLLLSFYYLFLHLTFFFFTKYFDLFFLYTLNLHVWNFYLFLNIENPMVFSFEICFPT